MANKSAQAAVHAASISDPEDFWSKQADQLSWHRKPDSAFQTTTKTLPDGTSHKHWSWFPGGEISTTYNCIDRHVKAGNGGNVSVIWDSPVTNTKEKITYAELQEEVQVLAGVMREEGVRRGDVVLIYMPMIPAALYAMLATLHLGALHTVVFGGFAPRSLAQRIEASKPKMIMTASCAIEGSKGVLAYRPFVEEAIERSEYKPLKTLIWQRDEKRWDPVVKERGQRNWQRLVKSGRGRGVRVEDGVAVGSGEGIYVIYTSGTTGSPKGVVREAGGHAVGLNLSIKYLFDIKGPGDVMFCASDIGWVVGHSYIVYAPLLAGATTILFEGKPIGTPNAGSFWRIIHEHRVTSLFTAPTALRAIRKDDPQSEYIKSMGEKGDLKHWRALFLAGERSEPSIVKLYQGLLNKYAARGAQVIDHWWSSESGSPMTGIALRPEFGKASGQPSSNHVLQIKPGSAGLPMPGFDVRVVDDDGKEIATGNMGNIVLGIPLAPTGFTTLFNDPVRFYKGYMKRFNGQWIDTGDAGMIDQDGYVHVMSRSDDVINVAAHRFSTGAIEQAILSHPSISEACVVSIPDTLKGHLPFAFISPSSPARGSEQTLSAIPPPSLFNEVNTLVRDQIGPIASLGGMIQGVGMIPKTRSGKTLRRVLKELLEIAINKEEGKEVNIPPTIEDAGVVDVARERVGEWARERRKGEGGEGKAKL